MRRASSKPTVAASPSGRKRKAGVADYSKSFDDEVSSESEDISGGENEESDEEEETAEEKRRRLAKDYLQGMVDGVEEESEDESEGERHAEVSEKLRRDRLEASGKYFQDLAGSLGDFLDVEDDDSLDESLSRLTLGGHKVGVQLGRRLLIFSSF